MIPVISGVKYWLALLWLQRTWHLKQPGLAIWKSWVQFHVVLKESGFSSKNILRCSLKWVSILQNMRSATKSNWKPNDVKVTTKMFWVFLLLFLSPIDFKQSLYIPKPWMYIFCTLSPQWKHTSSPNALEDCRHFILLPHRLPKLIY